MHRLTCLLIAGLALSCGLSDDPPTVQPDIGGTLSDGGPVKVPKPIVEPPPPTVCGESVAIRGTATPGLSVFAVGGLDSVVRDANSSTGRFCLPVRLHLATSNVIEVRVNDPVLGPSEPALVTVTQTTCPDDENPAPVPPDPTNVVLGLKARASTTAQEGNEGFLTDGNDQSVVTYNSGWVSENVWITLKLEKLTEIGKVVVKWRDPAGGGKKFASKYKVLLSSVADPGDPDLSNGYWAEAKSITSGDGGVDTFDLQATKPLAQHVALWLQEDGETSWSETYALAELEVWDSPKQSGPPPTPTDVCASSN